MTEDNNRIKVENGKVYLGIEEITPLILAEIIAKNITVGELNEAMKLVEKYIKREI